ncbi:MAG: hemolysin III family protein [Candidatus Delongbacteria bacterium]|nr:hemolysin III family protein [Candidatus Cloacimonadota bacterium]MCA9786802.1 hemolysin III family protein [Candidatus Cloacimonadota bacterium]MCB9472695.1 hemolysin III family protein [Candidatus Delongbacteria bacterium]
MKQLATHALNARSELASALTHGLGLLLAIAAMVAMLLAATGTRAVVAAAIFGGSLVLLYSSSTLYHSLPAGKARRVAQVLDHLSILVLIAGTYTPFTLLTLRGSWGWSLFGTVWGLAAAGFALELSSWRYRHRAGVVLYVLMGWVVLVAAGPLWQSLPTGGLWLLFMGGVAYTGGVGFYLARRRPWAHPVWHLCVLAGSLCHVLAVLQHVLPPA